MHPAIFLVGLDYKSLDVCPYYDGEVKLDFYGRLHPKHSNGTVKVPMETNLTSIVSPRILEAFDTKTDHRLLYRRLGITAENIRTYHNFFQMNLFADYEAIAREKRLQGIVSEIRMKYGMNSLFTA